MTNIDAKKLSKNLDKYISDAVKCNRVINVRTEDGNAVIMSAKEYNGLVETIQIMGNSATFIEIIESRKEPLNQGNHYNSSERW